MLRHPLFHYTLDKMDQKIKVVIVDIDGTIAKVGDRIKHLQKSPKDWNAFYSACSEDEPFKTIIEMVYNLSQQYLIMFCTGRRESCRSDTLRWIIMNFPYDFRPYGLLMRRDNDFRHDTLVKPELLKQYLDCVKLCDVAFILEDRNSMVSKWRELGYTCLQVADGDF